MKLKYAQTAKKSLGALVFGLLFGGLLFVGVPGSSVSSAPCQLGESPETHDCEAEEEVDCDPALESCGSGSSDCTGDDCGLIDKYLNPVINFLAIIVGLVVVISIVVGGIQYSSSGDDPQKVAKAKSRIISALIALLTFLFLYLILQWIIPGGLL